MIYINKKKQFILMKGFTGMIEIKKEFIKNLKTESGLTTKKFAEIAGLKGESYRTIMSCNERNFSLKSCRLWAEHFNIELKDFF